MRSTLSVLLFAVLTALSFSIAFLQPLTSPIALSLDNATSLRIAVPFGTFDSVKFSEPSKPSLVQTAAEIDWNGDNIASDAAWTRYTAKGKWYGCLFAMDNEQCGRALGDTRVPQSAESIWQGDLRQTLLQWGWYDSVYDSEVSCDFRDQGEGVVSSNKIQTALQSLGLSYLPFGKNGDNECFSIEHFDENLIETDDEDENPLPEDGRDKIPLIEQTYTVDNTVYPATGAYYRFAINRKGGAIFAQSLRKPQAAAEEEYGHSLPEDQMPLLQRGSDIMWSYWERNNPRPQDLRFYFVNYIRNKETSQLMARTLKNHKMDRVPHWPGLELDMNSEESQALLGSPIGSTIAHLLFQHKVRLGMKKVGSITIFRDNFPDDWRPEVQLLFKLVDVPFDRQIEWDEEMPDALDAKAKRMVPRRGVVKNSGKTIAREHRVLVEL